MKHVFPLIMDNLNCSLTIPVSYTHLDVYKRQLPEEAVVDEALRKETVVDEALPKETAGNETLPTESVEEDPDDPHI